jgi:hypothetical protein
VNSSWQALLMKKLLLRVGSINPAMAITETQGM